MSDQREMLLSNLGSLYERMKYRVEAIEERDGGPEKAVQGRGVGIGYLLARDVTGAIKEAADEIASLRAQAESAEALAKLNQTQLGSALNSGEAWKRRAENAEAQLASARKAAIEECVEIVERYDDCGATFIAERLRDLALTDDKGTS